MEPRHTPFPPPLPPPPPPPPHTNRSGPPVPQAMLTGITEADARKYAEAARPAINKVLGERGCGGSAWGAAAAVQSPGRDKW